MDTLSFIQLQPWGVLLQVHSFSDSLVHSFEGSIFTDEATEAHEQRCATLVDPKLAQRPRKGAQSSLGWKQTWREGWAATTEMCWLLRTSTKERKKG